MKSRKSISRDAHNSPQTSSSVRPGVRSSLHSSDQESDIEEDEATDADYTSPSVQERDRALLEEEEERENLLTVEGSGNTSRKVSGRSLNNRSEVKIDHGERRGKNRRKVRSKKEKYLWKKVEAGASMYEMEEGGGREDTSSLSSSSSAELDRLKYNYPSTLKVSRQPSLPYTTRTKKQFPAPQSSTVLYHLECCINILHSSCFGGV